MDGHIIRVSHVSVDLAVVWDLWLSRDSIQILDVTTQFRINFPNQMILNFREKENEGERLTWFSPDFSSLKSFRNTKDYVHVWLGQRSHWTYQFNFEHKWILFGYSLEPCTKMSLATYHMPLLFFIDLFQYFMCQEQDALLNSCIFLYMQIHICSNYVHDSLHGFLELPRNCHWSFHQPSGKFPMTHVNL